MVATTKHQRLDAIQKLVKYILIKELTPIQKKLVWQWFKIQKYFIKYGG